MWPRMVSTAKRRCSAGSSQSLLIAAGRWPRPVGIGRLTRWSASAPASVTSVRAVCGIKRAEAARGDNDLTRAIEHGHVRVGIVEAGQHVGGALGRCRACRAAARTEAPPAPPARDLDHFGNRIHRHALEAGGDAQDKGAAVADGAKLAGGGLDLAEGLLPPGSGLPREIVDRGIAEEARRRHWPTAPGRARAKTRRAPRRGQSAGGCCHERRHR